MRKVALFVTSILLIAGCASKGAKKSDEAFNKSDRYWYNQILKDVKTDALDKADEAYTSLASEHVASPLLKESMMILAKAHNKNEEYLMANYYIDEYIKRYASPKNIAYLKYLKIRSNFESFKRVNRDQKLLLDTIKKAQEYLKEFPNSKYEPEVQTMLTRLYLTNQILDRNIVALYKKTGKLKAAKIYEDRLNRSWLKNVKIKEAKKGFLSIF